VQRLDIDEFVEPTLSARIAALWVFGVGVAAAAAMAACWLVLMTHMNSLPVCDRLPWFQGVISLQALLLAAVPAALLSMGLATQRSGRWLPPRMWVLRRTRVLRGATATKRVCILIGSAAAIALIFGVVVVRLLALTADIASRWQCT
jgi:hypothetical protein